MGFTGFHRLWCGGRLSALLVFGVAIRTQHAWRGGDGVNAACYRCHRSNLVQAAAKHGLLAFRCFRHGAGVELYAAALC